MSPAPGYGGETASPPARRRLIIHGKVQGVYFRETLRGRAENRRVRGWVTNRADGTVEAALEGRKADVEALIGFCRQGPAHAEVEEVEVRDEEPEGLTDFKIE
ncbi:acylphosphatase [soil metagenome]